ncbi:MAG: alpha/beta hydrolase, partial [Actinomycetota bacterium]
MSRRRGLGAFAAVAAGVVAGAALEEYVYRRAFKRRPDPEGAEPIGTIPGDSLWVTAFDGTRLHVRAYGPPDAPRVLVLAHGAIESHVIWHYQVRDMLAAGGYRLLAYDARGHGSSGPARGPDGNTPLTAYTMARDLVAVVQQATEARVALVGHSMGGMVIQALWQHGENKHIADRIAGVVLTNTAYTADLRGWREGGVMQRAFERVEDILQRIPLPPKIVERLRPGTNDFTMLVGRLAYGRDPSPRHIATSVR